MDKELLKALKIVRDNGGPIDAQTFALSMWPMDMRGPTPRPEQGTYTGDGGYLFFMWIRGWLKRELVRGEDGILFNAGYVLSDKARRRIA